MNLLVNQRLFKNIINVVWVTKLTNQIVANSNESILLSC